MRRAAVLLLLLLLVVPAVADEKKPAPPKRLTEEQAADAVLAAVKAKDDAALKALAEKDEPDPWLVADELCYRGEHDAALAYARTAPRRAIEKLPDYVASGPGKTRDEQARQELLSAGTMRRAKDWEKALDATARAVSMLDSVIGVRLIHERAFVLKGMGRREEATAALVATGDAALALGWLSRASSAYYRAGVIAYRESDWGGASSAWESQLQIQDHLGNKRGVGEILTRVGITHDNRGQYEQALLIYRRARGIWVSFGNKQEVAAHFNYIGVALERLGRNTLALANFRRALPIQEALGDKAGLARTTNNMGIVHERLGAYAAAMSSYHRSMLLKEALGDKQGVAVTLNNMGIAYSHVGQYEQALSTYMRSLALKEAVGNKRSIAKTLSNIGLVQRALGDYATSLTSQRRSLEMRERLGDKWGIARGIGNIGVILESMGQYDEALASHRHALELKEALGDRRGASDSLICIGALLYRSGGYSKALESYDRALALMEDPLLRIQARIALGRALILFAQAKLDQAVERAHQGVELVTRLALGLAESESAGARDLHWGLYDVGSRSAQRAGRIGDLLWFLEQGRASSLREAMGSRLALEAAVIPAELLHVLNLARRDEMDSLAAYRRAETRTGLKATRRARQAWQEAQEEVVRVSARIQREAKAAAAITSQSPDDLETIQAHLRRGEALLLYGLTSAEGIALIVRPDSTRMVALPSTKEIESAVGSLLDHERHVSTGGVPDVIKMLVEPLQLGQDVSRVLISPTGRLGYVPFTLLFPGKEVVFVPSATTLGLLRKERPQSSKEILALGDPDYGATGNETALALHRGAGNRLARLPATRKEVEAVGTVKLLSEQASESGLENILKQQKGWRAVHFACHGLVDPERPLLSALALTGEKESDGFLTALEILRMKIPADLVVMSACETGKGKIYKTEGIVGLTRAFMFAGAPRVICSLWKVDDDATQALMIEFYRLWNPKDGKGLGAAAALKKAQTFIRDHKDENGTRHWKHAYYWAAWVLWGLPD